MIGKSLRRHARQRRRRHRRRGPEDDRADLRDLLLVRLRPLAGRCRSRTTTRAGCRDSVESPTHRAKSTARRSTAPDGRRATATRPATTRRSGPSATTARHRRPTAKVKASVFVVHGLQDINVKTMHFGQWWDALAEARRRPQDLAVPASATSTRSTSAAPRGSTRCTAGSTTSSWASTTASSTSPRSTSRRAPDQWVHLQHAGRSRQPTDADVPRRRSLTTGAPDSGRTSSPTTRASARRRRSAKGANAHRLLYVTGSLGHDVRISGEPTVELDVTPQARSARSVWRWSTTARRCGCSDDGAAGHDAEHGELLGRRRRPTTTPATSRAW